MIPNRLAVSLGEVGDHGFSVEPSLEAAINFYKKNGFQIIREEDVDIGNGYYMNDYVMSKSIGN